jgi:hypothetical protein
MGCNEPRYPIYIPSRGRAESRFTSRALEAIHVPYHMVVEPAQYEEYAAVIDPEKILVLPWNTDGTGLVKARNWIWDHATASGAERHWQLDDNIRWFARLHKNKKTRVADGICFCVVEDFVDRYQNVPQAGMQYEMFAPALEGASPFRANTRVYSNHLLINDGQWRFRGVYNDDTDLSLRILKAGYCTILVQAFLIKKITTMKVKGGNTPIYQAGIGRDEKPFDGRLEMAKSLVEQHPDVVRIVRKWGRWQHQVDYRPFKNNQLKLKPGVVIPQGVNNYGMVLKNREEIEARRTVPAEG